MCDRGAFEDVHRACDGTGVGETQQVVFGKRGLDVHGHVVKKAPVKKGGQHVRTASVGVELDGKSQVPHAADEGRKVGMQGGFAAGDDEALQEPGAPFKEGEDVVLGVGLAEVGLVGALDDELRVVAVGTTEIAPAGEHCGCDLSGVVDEVGLDQTAECHALWPLALAQLMIWLTPVMTLDGSLGSGMSVGTAMTPYFCASSWLSMASTTL